MNLLPSSPMHAGVFHAGVVIYGNELAYGGHEYEASGVFATKPRDPPLMPNGKPLQFRESIYIGESDLTEDEVSALIQRMGAEYRGRAYHLLEKNCNHFADDLAMMLVGQRIPGWINRLAHLAVTLHCLLPKTWVPPLSKQKSRTDPEQQSLIAAMAPRSDIYRAPNEKGILR